MNQVILYQNSSETVAPGDARDHGGVVIIFPTGDLPVVEVAKKDVPAGTPYLLIDREGLPDLVFQAALVADFSKPDGIGLGHDAWAAQYNDPLDIRNEAHAENARRDIWPVLIEMAERENMQWDAMHAIKDQAAARVQQ